MKNITRNPSLFLLFLLIPTYLRAGSIIYSNSRDTVIVERVDASDFILGFLYYYVEDDTVGTKKMQLEERTFLRFQRLPTEGIAEVRISSRLNMDSLINNYSNALESLKDSPHRDLYRRVCSDMVVKYLCSENKIEEANLNPPHNALIFFLNEMKESKSINIELIYTAFLKLQYANKPKDICHALSLYLPYFQKGVSGSEKQYSDFKAKSINDGSRDLILDIESKRVRTRKEYLADLLHMQRVVCKQ